MYLLKSFLESCLLSSFVKVFLYSRFSTGILYYFALTTSVVMIIPLHHKTIKSMKFFLTLKKRVLPLHKSIRVNTIGLLSWNTRPSNVGRMVAMHRPITPPTANENIKPSVSFFLSLTLILCLFSACQNTGKPEENAVIDNTTVDTTLQNTLPVPTEIPNAAEDINSTAQSSPQNDGPAKKNQPTPVTEEKPAQEETRSKSFDNVQPEANEEPPKQDLAVLNELRTLSEVERQEMKNIKATAEQLGGGTQAKALFTDAFGKEQEADQEFQLNTQIGYINSQRLYKTAKETYSGIVDQLNKAEKTLARQREAEKLRTEVAQVRQALPGTLAQLKANAGYQNAQERESIAEQYFKQANYEQAIKSFQRAKDLYANVTIAKPPVKVTPPPPPAEKKADNTLATRQIKGMLDTYASGLETADLNGLRAGGFISRQEEMSWSQFFRNVQDVTVKVQNEKLNINGNSATVNFNILMSFFNKSKRKREDSQFPKMWKMENNGGNWKITGFK